MKPVELMAHQKEAVLKLASGKILVGDVGSGKTLTAVAYYVAAQAPRDVYVITTAKKRDSLDWEDEFIKFGVWKTDDSTLQGVLTVDSWNNIGKYTGVKDAFFIFDEQRLVGSGAWTKSFYKIAKRNGWILLSATPGDTWLDYIPVFVANGFYRNKTEFIRRHVVYSPFTKYPKVQRYLESGVLVRRRNQIQVIMPYARHTTRHIHNVEVDYDRDLVREVMVKRWNIFKQEPMKDIADLFRVTRKIVNTDPSRLSTVRTLLEKHPRLIVFYNFDYELEILRTLGASSTLTTSFEEWRDSSRSSEESTSTGKPSSTSTRLQSSGNLGSNGFSASLESRSRSSSTKRLSESPDSQLQRSISTQSPSNGDPSSEPGSIPVPTDHRSGTPSSDSNPTSGSASTAGSSDHWNTGPLGKVDEWSQERLSSLVGSSSPIGTPKNGGESTPSAVDDGPSALKDPTLVVAEWNGHKHEPVPTSDRWVYLVQFTAGAEGWNCVTTDAMVFYSLPYSYKLWHQAHGRIDRLNTQYFDLHYYVLESKSWIDMAIRKSLRGKKSFNEASWGRKAA